MTDKDNVRKYLINFIDIVDKKYTLWFFEYNDAVQFACFIWKFFKSCENQIQNLKN